MPLQLQIISAHREAMGGGFKQEFAACGGTIGRSLQCDWPLPDSKRYISSQHAMIDYQGGAYYLVDLSRNGVFVNGSNTPVGKGNPQRIFDGDIIRLGEFEILANIVEDPNEAAEDGMRNSVVRAQMVPEDESIEMAMLSDDQIRDEHALERILEPGDTSGELSALSELSSQQSDNLERGAADRVLEETTAAFLTAAGLKAADFAGIEPATLLKNAAALLAKLAEGTHEMLVAKERILHDLDAQGAAPASGKTNPLGAAHDLDNALRLLLGRSNDINLSGTQAVEAAFAELLQHQQAMLSAMRSTLTEFIEHLEPAALENYFQHKDQPDAANRTFRNLYAEAFGDSSLTSRRRVPLMFDKKFAQAYRLKTAG